MEQKNKTNDISNRYLEFCLGHEFFAIPLLDVKEVIDVPKTTPVPQTPAFYVGIMNLRGQVVSILDLRKKLTLQPQKDNKQEVTIILDLGEQTIGVIVDSVNKVLTPAPDQVDEVNEESARRHFANYIEAIIRQENQICLILNLRKIFDLNQMKTAKAA